MCGLVGFLGGMPSAAGDEVVLRRMADTVLHRGPDDGGVWCDPERRIGLSHRRLAILDLSAAGHQPMVSAGGRFVIALNGEIYNHLALRETLGLGVAWRGHSDTETLLACIEAWGLEAALKKSVGMFALALWDRETQTLTLARDRLGEKPLYYGWQGKGDKRTFLFASELKALKAHVAFTDTIDRGALCLLLRHNYIPAPYSIYQGVAKLEPACLLSVSLARPQPKIEKYWDAVAIAHAGSASPCRGTARDAVEAVEVLIKNAVRQQMIADVPLGAFLSGGIDSSTVVALMQAQSPQPVKTFTIGFHEQGYDEAGHAKAVARHLGTDHTELYLTHEQALAVIPRLPGLYCEPFADSTQIPNFLVSQLARQRVTVSLSGDAGDELFCGYDRYWLTRQRWRKLSMAPRAARALLAQRIAGRGRSKRSIMLASRTVEELYFRVISHVADPSEYVADGKELPTWLHGRSIDLGGLQAIERMMLLDTISYLPDDILAKVDRAAMGVSLETRMPFLDHRLVEFAWTLPMRYKLRRGQSKWVLRELLSRYVPQALVDRPKHGFSLPLCDWLRGPLREWAAALLDEARLRREGYFYSQPIQQLWAAHSSGKRDQAAPLWSVLMFQAWLEHQRA